MTMRRWHARESATAHKPQSQPAERSGPVERLRCNEGGAPKPRYPHAQGSTSHANWYASIPEIAPLPSPLFTALSGLLLCLPLMSANWHHPSMNADLALPL
jgi:hypothetical protein